MWYPSSPRVNKSPLLPAMATGVSIHQPPTEGGHLLQFRLGEGKFWDSNYCLFIKHLCLRVVLFLKANCVVQDASEYRTVSLYAQITRRHCLIFRRTHKTVAISFVMSVCPSVRAEKLYFHPMGFHEILRQGFLVKSDKNDSHYMKTEHIYYAALLFRWKYKKSFAKVRTDQKKEVTVSKFICYNMEETRSERERREGRHRSISVDKIQRNISCDEGRT